MANSMANATLKGVFVLLLAAWLGSVGAKEAPLAAADPATEARMLRLSA